jgi:signal transduction histidine kinase/CheY-like chemotaxis protein/HPt (histidine-containing phosphotransfer) domain-containing protein
MQSLIDLAQQGFILLSGLVGGPLAALVTTAAALAARGYLGGAGMAGGLIYICVFAAVGIAAHFWSSRRGESLLALGPLFLLASLATLLAAPVVLMLPSDKVLATLTGLWPKMYLANLVGVAVLGTLLRREKERLRTERVLEAQRALAERGTLAKSRFLAAMSHDIRTPLNAILGILQIVDRPDLPGDVRRDLASARNSGTFLLTLINQVLDFARIEAGRIPVGREPFSIDALLGGLAGMFKPLADEKGLRLICRARGLEDLSLVGDYAHIQQVLFNLVGNAVKFTDEGTVRIEVVAEPDAPGRIVLAFSVEDTGPGIAPEDREIIFDEFGQAGTGRAKGGSGLGLSIARELADALDGSIELESDLGRGTCFRFRVSVEVAEKEAVLKQDTPSDVGSAEMAPARILVVEDNALNRHVVQQLLQMDGHSVRLAGSGREAIELLRVESHAFDLVLMDIQMPMMDGVEATTAIRRFAPDPQRLPIIALTANAFEEQRETYRAAGMQAVLTKPVDHGTLRTTIDQFSARAEADPATEPAAEPSVETVTEDAPDSTNTVSERVDAQIIELVAGTMGGAQLKTLIGALDSESARLVATLKDRNAGAQDVRFVAHELKGMLGNFGFSTASRLAAKFEVPSLPEDVRLALADRLEAEIGAAMRDVRQLADAAAESA